VIDPAQVQDLIGRWWFHYDQARFDELRALLTEDTRFVCRTDTGETDFEEFVRADVSGRDAVMAWQTEHRTGSPDPLRHHGTNVHLVGGSAGEADFASYLFVSQVVGGLPAPLSTAIVTGTVRDEPDGLRIALLTVVLDTRDSIPLGERAAGAAQG
jgi:hypothetical protein